ncbi:zinc-finger associated domain (zf-AD) domain-containing protein [Phthorimaea operculella]|nr:zinc-finger associated domain (zf-AD) domain-containing protein [Phthorimaea operculella]
MAAVNRMPNLKFDKICRACLQIKKDMRPLFEQLTATMLMGISKVEVAVGDGLPAQLCLQCVHQISRCHAFKELVERNDVTLHQHAKYLQEEAAKQEVGFHPSLLHAQKREKSEATVKAIACQQFGQQISRCHAFKELVERNDVTLRQHAKFLQEEAAKQERFCMVEKEGRGDKDGPTPRYHQISRCHAFKELVERNDVTLHQHAKYLQEEAAKQELTDSVTTLRTQCAESQVEIDQHIQHIDSLERARFDLINDLHSARDRCKFLNQQLNEANKQLADLHQEKEDIENKFSVSYIMNWKCRT